MKDKIIIAILAVLVFVSALNVQSVYADANHYMIVVYASGDGYKSILYNCESGTNIYLDGSSYRCNKCRSYGEYYASNIELAYREALGHVSSLSSTTFNTYTYVPKNSDIILCVGFSGALPVAPNIFSSTGQVNNHLNPPWYKGMWDDFGNFLGSTGQGIVDFFDNLIDSVFGDDNNGGTISDNVQIGNPTIAPTPTPIPYTTVVIPKTDVTTGETYYETNYYYVNPSGTPIITSYPPVNAPTNNGGGDGGQTYSPVNGKPYSIPKLDWLSTVDIDGTGYDGIDSIGDGMNSVDEIGSEYIDGMSVVEDASGTLPSSWLLLIGIVAAIPLLAGIVSRFLGG